jgi:hypothetical protein
MSEPWPQRNLPDPKGGCACWVNPEPWTYYGIAEPGDSLEYDPACPVHSVHLYDPRAGMWIERPEAMPS